MVLASTVAMKSESLEECFATVFAYIRLGRLLIRLVRYGLSLKKVLIYPVSLALTLRWAKNYLNSSSPSAFPRSSGLVL